LGFLFFKWDAAGVEGQPQMFERGFPIRKAGIGAVDIVIVVCLVTASFGQDATGDTAQKKPATAKTTTSSKSHHSAAATTKISSKTHSASGKRSSKKKSARARGQQKIDGERAQAIQEALIREHYLSGEATGTWNQASEEAMRRYQADHGWQSKTVPDSRALIKLGLGPSKDHLLNPDSAMTTVPDAPKSQPMPTSSYSGAPSANPGPPAAPASTPAASASSSPQ
jgi:Putative peptidoglycan binding domain